MRIMMRQISTGFLVAALTCIGMAVVPAPAAVACPVAGCGGGGGGGGGGAGDIYSSAIQQADLNTSKRSCSVFANGGGMGMYCVTVDGSPSKTLRERYGRQKLQLCRYSEIPDAIRHPFNSRPSEGRYMVMSCLGNIDFDTYSGGHDRTLDVSVVFVEMGTDITDHHNPITDFLWNQFNSSTKMPIPFMQTRPNVTPLVGIPTYFTFRWINPSTNPSSQSVVAQGPYAGKPNGGPYKEITTNGVVMRAEATRITVQPNQTGIPPIYCDPSTPYVEGAAPKDQPANACAITFPRSSASARKFATEAIPDNIKDAFYATIEVRWNVTYGAEDEAMRTLGDGFTMRLHQVLPVQEVQAPNQPPAVIY